MVLSTSSVNTPIMALDGREALYYGKYRYRARLKLMGLNRTYRSKTMIEFLKNLQRYAANPWRPADARKEIDAIDLDSIARYIDWRNNYATPVDKSKKQAMIRVESITAGIFSNDLKLLQTLESIAGADAVDYTEIDVTIPTGIKYFANEPNYKYRVYLKSKRVDDKFTNELQRFIDRYKDTQTVIVASRALTGWLNGNVRQWLRRYCSSHYFIEYNDESTNSLIGLMFGDMIKCRFKLEKRPD